MSCYNHVVRTKEIENERTVNVLHVSGCVDRDTKCDEYLLNGDCESKPFLMSGLCQASCEFCDSACEDWYVKCQWEPRYSCENDKPDSWDWTRCAFSCGCDPGEYFFFLTSC